MLEFCTEGFQGYAVKYSPFFDNRIAVATSANFGLVGNGRLYILELAPGGIQPVRWYPTQDALYDVAHSESHSSHLLTSSGDGSLRLFDISLEPAFPIAVFSEHGREAFCCSWNLVSKSTFASSSWDGTVKIWNPERERSVLTLPTQSCTYAAQWSPHTEGLISAASSDSTLRLWDLRSPGSAQNHLQLTIPIHAAAVSAASDPVTALSPRYASQSISPSTSDKISSNNYASKAFPSFPPNEALTVDWNKYRPTTLAVAGVDRIIRTFDIRQPTGGPTSLLQGHDYAVRKIAWSPHASDLLLSASYDMTCRLWKDGTNSVSSNPATALGELGRMGRHTEFVTGVDWCLFGAEGWAASCAWDQRVCVWDAKAITAV